ncbi:hypothetical protein L7F22_067971 [Adiantum nelumboides]|nr:hypothetical protein [Adiantum nelumboides]
MNKIWISVGIIAFIAIAYRIQQNYGWRRTLVDEYSDNEIPLNYFSQKPVKLARLSVNNTLDFQKVFVINLPDRFDRRDQIAIMAAVSEIEVEYVDGVRIKEENLRSNRFPSQEPKMTATKLGCFRAHANLWRKIISENIATALILEDDIDWDFRLKEILSRSIEPLNHLMRGSESIKQSRKYNKQNSRQSWVQAGRKADWDILRLGTCVELPHTKEAKAKSVNLDSVPFTVFRDSSVPDIGWISRPYQKLLSTYKIPIAPQNDTSSASRFRLIQQSNYPVCLHAYAITRAGAAKLLIQTGKGLIDGANDLTIAVHTQEERYRSFTFVPPVFSQWKRVGWSGNSDNGDVDLSHERNSTSSLNPGLSWDIREGVRAVLNDDDYSLFAELQ